MTSASHDSSPTIIATFSGIDGAGKSTQINSLSARLRADGMRVLLFKFWDDVAMLTGLRSKAGHRLFKGDQGIGSPSAPVNRRDKNVQSRLMTGIRMGVYLLDAVSCRLAVEKALRSGADLVIFDRYIYDELANLTLSNPIVRAYARLLMTFVPKPNISYFLDADPVKACARKPEYPLEFLHVNRQSYLDLSELLDGITVIDPMPAKEVHQAVLAHAQQTLSFKTTRRDAA